MFLTMVEGMVDEERDTDLFSAWDERTSSLPPGLVRSFLLSSGDGRWRIVTIWESQEAVAAMRASGDPPAAPLIFERAGSQPSLSMWSVERHVDPSR